MLVEGLRRSGRAQCAPRWTSRRCCSVASGDDVLVTAPSVAEAMQSAHRDLCESGTWWDAEQVAAIARRAAAVVAQRSRPPWMRVLDANVAPLGPEVVAAVDMVATNAGSIDRRWAHEQVARFGDGAYVELVGITAVGVMLQVYAEIVGDARPRYEPVDEPGHPTGERPAGVGDIGAHVEMLDPFPMANVARALSLVPSANRTFLALVHAMYSEPGFSELVWDTPLIRPQVELVAARVAAMNECFY
mgnify:CR=1 FL=1